MKVVDKRITRKDNNKNQTTNNFYNQNSNKTIINYIQICNKKNHNRIKLASDKNQNNLTDNSLEKNMGPVSNATGNR